MEWTRVEEWLPRFDNEVLLSLVIPSGVRFHLVGRRDSRAGWVSTAGISAGILEKGQRVTHFALFDPPKETP